MSRSPSFNDDVARLQACLIDINQTVGIRTADNKIGGPDGMADGICGSGTRRALEELVVLAQKHAGVGAKDMTKEITPENLKHIEQYLKDMKVADHNRNGIIVSLLNMQDSGDLDRLYNKQPPIISIRPDSVKLPYDTNDFPKTLTGALNVAAVTVQQNMSFFEYRMLVDAGPEKNKTFEPRMDKFEEAFHQRMKDTLRSAGFTMNEEKMQEISKAALAGGVFVSDNPQINRIVNQIKEQPLMVAIPKSAYDKETPSDLRDAPRPAAVQMLPQSGLRA